TKPVRQAEERPAREVAEEKQPPRWSHETRFREAMSRMRADDMPEAPVSARAQASVEPVETGPPRPNWRGRWGADAQRVPPVAGKAAPADLATDARAAEAIVTPIRVMLALLVLLLALGAFELLFRRTEWRR